MINVFHFHLSVLLWPIAVGFTHRLHSDPHFVWDLGCIKSLVIEWQLLPVNTLIEKCNAGKFRSVRD